MFDLQLGKAAFELIAERFGEQRDRLNALDSEAGDGDHGHTMARAFSAAAQAAQGAFRDFGALFDAASQAVAVSAGGSIGPLLAALFAEGGVVLVGKSELATGDWAQFISAGLDAVREVGGAQSGEKTLVDALAPAADALREHDGSSLGDALQEAARAAEAGAERTRSMVARHGRARFLGERSRGFQDPGATSIAMIFAALRDVQSGVRASRRRWDERRPAVPPPGKLINHPDDMIPEELQGLALAHPRFLRLAGEDMLVRASPKRKGRVGLAIGHGGGHTPSMAGFVGPGLLDADVYGPVFTCAPGVRIAEAIAAADRGAGVVLLISNHAGDVLNARTALRRAGKQGIDVRPVVLGDDIATADRAHFRERRGLGGLLFALKIGGAAAEQGAALDEVVRLMDRTNERTATLMVALRPATHPASGQPLYELPAGQIEVGAGVHGEAGVYRGVHMGANELIDLMLQRLVDDLEGMTMGKVLAFINGAGGTSMMELHILHRRVHYNLQERGLTVAASVVGSYFTTQEMSGFSLSLCAVDEEMLHLWDQPASGPFFRWS